MNGSLVGRPTGYLVVVLMYVRASVAISKQLKPFQVKSSFPYSMPDRYAVTAVVGTSLPKMLHYFEKVSRSVAWSLARSQRCRQPQPPEIGAPLIRPHLESKMSSTAMSANCVRPTCDQANERPVERPIKHATKRFFEIRFLQHFKNSSSRHVEVHRKRFQVLLIIAKPSTRKRRVQGRARRNRKTASEQLNR